MLITVLHSLRELGRLYAGVVAPCWWKIHTYEAKITEMHTCWGSPPQRAPAEHRETNRRALQNNMSHLLLGSQTGLVPSAGWRGAATSSRRAQRQCKQHRNKWTQAAFRDFGHSPEFLVPYLELALPCWASRHRKGAGCLCDREELWMFQTYIVHFHHPAQQMMWDMHILYVAHSSKVWLRITLTWEEPP